MGPSTNSTMPTAAAVAAAAATAKIQALDAVASNAVLGLSANTPASLGMSPITAATVASKVSALPITAAAAVGAIHPPGIGVPATTVAGFHPGTVFQTPNVVAQNILAPPGIIGVTANMPVVATPTLLPATTLAAAAAVNTFGGLVNAETDPSIAGMVAVSAPKSNTANAAAAAAAAAVAVASSEQIKKAHEKKQEELQKKLMEEGETQTLQQQENMSIKGQSARQLVMQRLMRPQESKVIILRNMVGPEDVDETLQEEIQEECTKFGTVSRVIIFNEKQTENEDDEEAEIIVKIFVEFSNASEAIRGRNALHERFFGGRRVTAELYDQALFDHGDLSG